MTSAPQGPYREFPEEANRLVSLGLRALSPESFVALARSLRGIPSDPLRADLKRLLDGWASASTTQRFRLFFRALSSGFLALQSNPSVPRIDVGGLQRTSFSPTFFVEVPDGDANLSAIARGRVGKYQALAQITQGVPIATMTVDQLVPLLTNTDLAGTVLSMLTHAPGTKRLEVAEALASCHNVLLKRASLAVTTGIPPEYRARFLLRCLTEKPIATRAGMLIAESGVAALRPLTDALATTDETPRRVQLLRVMRRLRGLQPPRLLGDLATSPDTTLAYWSRVTLNAMGQDQTAYLREAASAPDLHQRRIFAKRELVRSGNLKDRMLVAELDHPDPLAHAYAAEAIGEMENLEELLAPLITTLTRSGDKTARLAALQRLSHFDDPRIFEALREASKDPAPEIRKRAIARLVALRGFVALEEYFDLGPVLTREYDELSFAQHRYLLFHVLPLLRHVPDHRFARYLAKLTADTCDRGVDFDFEVNLKPILIAFGEAMTEELGELARSTNAHLSTLAEELLLKLPLGRAEDLVRKARSSQDPLLVAFRNLRNASLRGDARKELAAAGRAATPVVLPGLEDPEVRADVCWIFGQTKDAAALPKLVALMGEAGDPRGGSESDTIARPRFFDGPVTHALAAYGGLASKHLKSALTNGEWSVRAHACCVVGKIGDFNNLPTVRILLSDNNPDVALAAMDCVAEMRDEESVATLANYLKADNTRLMAGAVQALVMVGTADSTREFEAAIAAQKDLSRRRLLQNALTKIKTRISESQVNSKSQVGDMLRGLFRTRTGGDS